MDMDTATAADLTDSQIYTVKAYAEDAGDENLARLATRALGQRNAKGWACRRAVAKYLATKAVVA